jgi:hypothetical protein
MILNTADYAHLMGVRYQATPKCCACDQTDAVHLVTVRDVTANRMLLRGYMCPTHADLHRSKGHEIWQNGSKLEDFT